MRGPAEALRIQSSNKNDHDTLACELDQEDPEVFLDSKATLILLATSTSKTATEISHDCDMPLSTTYRKLDKLLQQNLVKICGRINDGKRYMLFTNNAKVHHFKNSQRALGLMNVITQNPGLSFREVVRASGLTNGVVSHYLSHLQKRGLVQTRRARRKTWHFASDMPLQEMDLIVHLRNGTSHEIFSRLLERQSLTFYELTRLVNRCPASISLRLAKLVKEGHVRKTGWPHPTYSIRDVRLVSKTMERISRRGTVAEGAQDAQGKSSLPACSQAT